jgi:hypothetical protein
VASLLGGDRIGIDWHSCGGNRGDGGMLRV